MKDLLPVQKGFIEKHGFGFVFDIKSFRVPVEFIEWVMSNTFATSYEFLFNEKSITFTKEMVVTVLGVPSGSIQVDVDCSDFEDEALVKKFKAEYKEGKSYPIRKCVELMTAEQGEQAFMRHFMLFLISTILIPGKSNTLCVEYLPCLLKVELIPKLDWADEILHVVMHEVHRFHTLRDYFGHPVAKKHFYMEGCLPLLAVSIFSFDAFYFFLALQYYMIIFCSQILDCLC